MSATNIHAHKDIAKKRWLLLAKMITQKKCELENDNGLVSVRRFSSFGLLKTSLLNYENDESDGLIKSSDDLSVETVKRHLWYDYSCLLDGKSYHATIRHLDGSISLKELLGFNNTGNVCVWPSEEVLTYYCLKNVNLFSGKKVCELGGGMTCLAGIFLSVDCDVSEMLLTDGNVQSVQIEVILKLITLKNTSPGVVFSGAINIRLPFYDYGLQFNKLNPHIEAIIDSGKNNFGNSHVHSRALLWNEFNQLGDLQGHFDTVICADCLFFDEYRQDLIHTLYALLTAQGEAIMFAPKRGKTFDSFITLSEELFTVKVTECYDENIWSMHMQNKEKGLEAYDEDLHYPLLLQLKKKPKDEVNQTF